MKKLLICVLVLIVALAVVACGGDDTQKPNPDVTQGPENTPDSDVKDPDDDGAHTHDFKEVVTLEPTCTSLGKKEMKCSCGAVEGNEMPLPFAPHNAKEATCTEDSVCSTCGKVLTEKYGHLFVDSVVTEATCTVDGLARSTCHRCGTSTDTVVAAGHTYDLTKLTVSKGSAGSTCTKCGQTVTFAEKQTILKLDFDSEAEFANYPAFTVEKPSGMKYENSTLQTNGALWFKYGADVIPSNSKLLVSFDFKLTTAGLTHRGESIFSFTSRGGNSYAWIVKYYQADGVLSTQDSGHNASNSVPATLNKWYNCTAILDTATNTVSVYIDGVSIGSKTVHNHNDAKYNNNFELRFFDVKSNGVSMPYYDNFKLVEIK